MIFFDIYEYVTVEKDCSEYLKVVFYTFIVVKSSVRYIVVLRSGHNLFAQIRLHLLNVMQHIDDIHGDAYGRSVYYFSPWGVTRVGVVKANG